MSIGLLCSSQQFNDSADFVELTTSANDNRQAREIYLSNREIRGRARVMSTAHWLEFQTRLGMEKSATPYKRVEKMTFGYFRKLESELLRRAGVNSNVAETIFSLIDQKSPEIDELRQGIKQIRRGTIKEIVFNPIRKLKNIKDRIGDHRISTQRLAAAITIISDAGVIVTSRDWGVAGTISTMAGAAIAASSD